MKFEHWKDDCGHYFSPADTDDNRSMLKMLLASSKRPKLCCVIEADTWEDAMEVYHKHQGWEPYKRMT